MGLNRKFRKLLNAQLLGMTAGDIMEPEVITVNENATLDEVYSLISKYHHLGYPVVNEEHKIVGVISYKDIFRVRRED